MIVTLKLSSALLALVLLAGCSQTRTTATTPDVCLLWGEQSYSAKGDTPQTVAEIRDRNAKRNSYCKGK